MSGSAENLRFRFRPSSLLTIRSVSSNGTTVSSFPWKAQTGMSSSLSMFLSMQSRWLVNPLIGAMAANVSGYRAAMYQLPEPPRLGPVT